MSNKSRYHPFSILIHTILGMRVAIPILLLIFFRKAIIFSWLGFMIFGITLIFLLIYAVIRFWTEYFKISDQKIITYKGVLRRKESDIPYERIQTIQQRQWFFLKPFHICTIVIKTAAEGNKTGEIIMPAVSTTIFHQIEFYKKQRKQGATQPSVKAATQFTYTISNSQIFLFGITDVTVFAGIFTVLFFIQEHIPNSWFDQLANMTLSIIKAGWIIGLSLTIIFVFSALIVALIKNFFQYYRFKVSRVNDALIVERGLLERDIQNIPIDKIQAIQIKQQPIRSLLHISTVELLLTSGKDKDSDINQVRFLPIIDDYKLFSILNQLLSEEKINQPQIQYSSRGKILYFWRWYVLIFLAIGVISCVLKLNWIIISIESILLALLLLMNWLDCHYQGYVLQTNERICIQNFEIFTKVQTFINRPKIQSLEKSSSYWLYKKELGHVRLNLKVNSSNKMIKLRYIEQSDIKRIVEFYRI